jgi:hypothetical protein
MEKPLQMNPQEIKIQGLIDRYLATRPKSNLSGSHLDQDTLAAFTEGTLTEREATPVVTHLADCSFCRHISAELIRLDLELAEESPIAASPSISSEPTKVSEVLGNLFAKIFGTTDSAVFAHEEKDEKADGDEDENKKN